MELAWVPLSIIMTMLEDQAAWPREIYSVAQVRAFDRHAIDNLGIDGFELMQRAGSEALRFLIANWPAAKSVLIYCGAGNNAGDGYVLAGLAVANGLNARVVAVVDPGKLPGDAAKAVALARQAGVEIGVFPEDPGSGDADVLVDALLGSGIARDVDGAMAEAVAKVNSGSRPVLSLDIPTGVDGDSGAIRGVAVDAAATITFVGLKAGLYLGEAPNYRGLLGFADLALPPVVYAGAAPVLRRLDESDLNQLLRPRSRMAHKGSNGRILIVGGSAGMAGAARLAAEAALRAGAGLVYAAVAPASVGIVMADRPEIMCRGVADPSEIEALAATVDVIVIGPGLGRDAWGQSLARMLLAIDKPLVVDADGLNYLAGHRQHRNDWVLTPHPAEAARLLDCPIAAVQTARREAVTRLAVDYGALTVLKGTCSLVTEPTDNNDISVSVCDYGNPGMATGGTGDVLAGVIGGLIAQFGLSRAAVEAGVLVHALAGDDAAKDGERGLIATDLLAHIRRRVNPV
jgi:NAD(P)H-hydrate epimerase